MTVVFSGENPGLVLFKPGTDEVVAAASFWRCVYSEHGEGNALIIWTDKDSSGLGGNAPHAIYTDNPGVARLVTDRFTQHFERFQDRGFGGMETRHARFFQDSDSRWYHRVVCNTGYAVIELTWWDVLESAESSGHFSPAALGSVREFMSDPFAWSLAHGGKGAG